MSRREFPAKVKVAAFKRAADECEGCKRSLKGQKFHYDHVIPDALGGEPVLSNCQVLCTPCHQIKTGKQDVPAIAKAKRVEARHLGIKPEGRPLTDATPRKTGAASKPLTRALPERKRPLFA